MAPHPLRPKKSCKQAVCKCKRSFHPKQRTQHVTQQTQERIILTQKNARKKESDLV